MGTGGAVSSPVVTAPDGGKAVTPHSPRKRPSMPETHTSPPRKTCGRTLGWGQASTLVMGAGSASGSRWQSWQEQRVAW